MGGTVRKEISNDKQLLKKKGSVRNALMEQNVRKIYEEFDKCKKKFEALEADKEDLKEIENIEQQLKKREK